MRVQQLMKRIRSGDQNGFLILEAMIATAVFAIFMVAVIAMLTGAMRTNVSAREVSEASSMAASVGEWLLALPYNDPNLTNGMHPLPAQGQYNLSYAVGIDALINNTLNIRVTVSWPDERFPGGVRNVNMDYIKNNTI